MTDERFRKVEWPHSARIPVLGVMMTFLTDSVEVMAAIRDTYGAWTDLERRGDISVESNATVKIVVDDCPHATEAALAISHRVPDPTRLLVDCNGGTGVADTTRLESRACVTEGVVARRAEFVDGVLEPLSLFLLGALDRQPLHAAGIVRDDAAILLAGPSGAGKSTLTYAACRHGYSLLADEPVYIQTRPVLRVWGRRPRLHLPVEARTHFPELNGVAPTRLLSGKTKMIIDLPARGRRFADRAAICIVRRAAGDSPELERVHAAEVVAELEADLDPGFDLFVETIGERIRAVAERGAWSLSMGRRPEEAVPLLDEIAAELAGGR